VFAGATGLQIADDRSPAPLLGVHAGNWRLFESCDVDETRERISSVMQPHSLSPVGSLHRHRGAMNYISLGNVGIGTIQFGRMKVDVPELCGYHLLMFCLTGHAVMELDDQLVQVEGGTGLHVLPGDRFCGEFSQDCEQLVIRIDIPPGAGSRLNDKRLATSTINQSRARPWLNIVRDIVCDPAAMDLIRTDSGVAGCYASLLTNLIATTRLPEQPGVQVPVPACVKRAERFMVDNLADEIDVAQIALAAGVSVRTLQDAFVKFRNQSRPAACAA